MRTASESLVLLREGNHRFANNLLDRGVLANQSPQQNYIENQRPHAIIVGCSDSRVPVELVFDQGLGDLFVVRVAGNVVAPSQVGSIEFAAMQFNTKLVVVLGHTKCGAINATINTLLTPSNDHSPNVLSILDRISPHIAGLVEESSDHNKADLLRQAMRANVRASVQQLRESSQVLESLTKDEGLEIVGADYDIETGVVDFFDGVPLGSD